MYLTTAMEHDDVLILANKPSNKCVTVNKVKIPMQAREEKKHIRAQKTQNMTITFNIYTHIISKLCIKSQKYFSLTPNLRVYMQVIIFVFSNVF